MDNESQTDKKVQFDRITNHLNNAGFLPTAASEDYTKPKNPDGLFNKVKELWADRLVDRPKAAMLDQVRNRLGLPGNATVDDIMAKMVPVDEAAIRKDQNNKTINEVISKAQTLIK